MLENSSAGRIAGDTEGGILNYGTLVEVNNAGFIGASTPVTALKTRDHSGAEQQRRDQRCIRAINNTRQIDTINNSGRLLGSVTTANTTLNLTGTTARISGAVVNTGGSVNMLTGADFTTESTFNSNVFNVNSGATLRVGNSAHGLTVNAAAADAFNNAGTLRVGEGVLANVVGNYTQSGAVRLGASSVSSYGRVAVQGDAALTSPPRFFVDVNTVNTLADGQVLAGVVSATGTLTNAAATNNVSDGSALFNFTSVTNGNAVDLVVAAAGTRSRQAHRARQARRAMASCLR